MKQKLKKICTVLVIAALVIACLSSVAGGRFEKEKYGRLLAVSALYEDAEAAEPHFDRISYATVNPEAASQEDAEQAEGDDSAAQLARDKAAMQALAVESQDTGLAAEAEERSRKYQLNEIREISTSTDAGKLFIMPAGSGSVQLADGQHMGKYLGRFVLTAYCPCIICCGNTSGITASGARATPNHTIAADKRFAFGTKMVINGIVYTVEDRGGAIQGNHIDIFFRTHAEACAFGKKEADVYLYTGEAAGGTDEGTDTSDAASADTQNEKE